MALNDKVMASAQYVFSKRNLTMPEAGLCA